MYKKLFTIIVALFVAMIMVVPTAMAGSEADADAKASVKQVYGDSYSRTGLAVPPQMTYPGLPSYFGPATNQPNYMKAANITMFKKSFNRDEIDALLSSNQGFSGMKSRVNVFTGEIPKDERMSDDTIDVLLTKPEGNYAPVGYITIYGSKNRDSVDVFYAALEEAINTLECEEVLMIGEGAMNILSTWGAGIGFSYTQAFLNDGNNKGDASGGSGTGGTGISWGEAGYRAKPWLQFILLNNLDTPTRHKVE